MRNSQRAHTPRACGKCTLCCELLEIKELSKPNNSECPHQYKKGCRIYRERPGECRTFSCEWLKGKELGPGNPLNYRPDKLGLVFWHQMSRFGVVLSVMEQRPQKTRKEPLPQRVLERLAKQETLLVIDQTQDERTLRGPPEIIDRLRKEAGEYDRQRG